MTDCLKEQMNKGWLKPAGKSQAANNLNPLLGQNPCQQKSLLAYPRSTSHLCKKGVRESSVSLLTSRTRRAYSQVHSELKAGRRSVRFGTRQSYRPLLMLSLINIRSYQLYDLSKSFWVSSSLFVKWENHNYFIGMLWGSNYNVYINIKVGCDTPSPHLDFHERT